MASGNAHRNDDLVVVDVADFKVSQDPRSVIVTYALGSCIALCLYDPVRKTAGMIHYMLPMSKASPEKAKTKPAMFADTGIALLFEQMFALGCRKEDLVVKAAGGGSVKGGEDMFQIGKRNYTLLRKLLWKNGLMIAAEDVGGSKSRTVRLFVGDGRVVVSSQGEEAEL